MKKPSSRLPSDVGAAVLNAGDPQADYSQVFGGGTVGASKAPEKTDAAKPATPETNPPKRGSKPAARKLMKAKPEPGNWSRKTYRLRPDQYQTLAVLEAILTSESGRRIAASELAREAFDLLFAKHKQVLARASSEPVAEESSSTEAKEPAA